MADTILDIKNLNSRDTDGYFVKDINLELKTGEIHVLVGENGSGKSLFYDAISGKKPHTTGKIIYKDKTITITPSFKGLEGVSYIQRYPKLIENISIAENMFIFMTRKKSFYSLLNWGKMYKKTEEILNCYGLKTDPARKVSLLTQEERKVLEIAKFQLQDNQVILFHEPTDEIGINTIRKFYELLLDYKNMGRSILIITRNWEEALKIADRITVIANGKIAGTMEASAARENPYELLDMLMGRSDYKEDNNRIMATIFKAAEFLTSEYELNDVLYFISRQIMEIMNAQKCVLELVDEKTNSLIAQVSYNPDNIAGGKLKRDKVMEKFADSNQLLCISKDDESFLEFVEGADDTRTVICMPVLIRSRITGIIQLFYNDYYLCTDDELIYLSTLARQVAIAVEYTRSMGRSALLMESHHRIKNNLQSIVSLINLQKDFIDRGREDDIKDILDKIISRISSIAFVHDLLSKDEYGRSILNIKQLINIIADFYSVDSRIKMELDIDNIFISYSKATSIALIINELINNCYEHAFGKIKNGMIKIKCKKKDEKILLEVVDNGCGIPQDFDLERLDSLGLSIVRAIISNEFRGEMEIKPNTGISGTQVLITLSTARCFI
ncbi:MAG: ATP-binding cassette domain-containing protein [Halanaerobiaceae bacterium]|jgi:ribose transport system ATP-binding protein|nr:ATP-binding cassette domain-containing protein [Halanaerobiaceae bacterium]